MLGGGRARGGSDGEGLWFSVLMVEDVGGENRGVRC